ncbi:MAG: hypothetical protein Q7S22_08980 [Candidatus Micrarchaeota archaeon]|nr:hypothetical protein [Candidatus Micrarchaeota archaeon]
MITKKQLKARNIEPTNGKTTKPSRAKRQKTPLLELKPRDGRKKTNTSANHLPLLFRREGWQDLE